MESRIGEIKLNNQGIEMKIIEYNDYSDIIVEFKDGSKRNTTYNCFKCGRIKSKFFPSVFFKGYMGEGKYLGSINGKSTEVYKSWQGMLRRCYDEKCQEKQPTYKDCIVCDEWHNFQNFAKWYEENIWDDICICLDKDILIKGNKIYSPLTCVLVDRRLNSLFIKSNKSRGKYLIGVNLYKKSNKYISHLAKDGKSVHLGLFNTEEEAFVVYKIAKENYIKEIANEYKEKYQNFPDKLYQAMIKYEVDISD